MSRAPWYKRYAADFVSDPYVQAMTAEQYGWYSAMLDMMWIHTPQGCLPNDEQLLSKMIGRCDHLYFHEQNKIVLDRFKVTEDGQWLYHPKMMEQVDHMAEVSEKRRDAGKKGASNRTPAKKQETNELSNKCSANAQQMPTDSDSDSDIKSMCVGPADPEARILALVQAHPKGKKYDTFDEVPYIVQQAIVEAITREAKKQSLTEDAAYQYLLERTRLYESYVSLWPKSEQSKCYRLEDWFNRKGYRDEPETWSRDAKQSEQSKPSAAEQRQNTIIENAKRAREMFLGRVRDSVPGGVCGDTGDLSADHHARGTKPVAGEVVEVSGGRGD